MSGAAPPSIDIPIKTGLIHWGRADRSLYKDTGVSVPCVNDGDVCLSIKDLSSSANNSVRFGATSGTYRTNQIGGNPAFQATVVNLPDFVLSSAIALPGAFTIYVVGIRAVGQTLNVYAGGGASAAFAGPYQTGAFYTIDDSNTSDAFTGPGAGTPLLYRISRASAGSVPHIRYTGFGDTGGATVLGAVTFSQMFFRPLGGLQTIGLMGEWAVYNVNVSPSDETTNTSYFNAFWGVTF